MTTAARWPGGTWRRPLLTLSLLLLIGSGACTSAAQDTRPPVTEGASASGTAEPGAVEADGTAPPGAVDLRIQPDEVEAVLAILDLRARGEQIPESAWKRLFATEGYARMMARERAINEQMGLHREFKDEKFRRYFATDSTILANRAVLREALDVWKRVDVERAGRRALAYLPAGTRIYGTIYPLLREETNSFIFELRSDNPAIFMYLSTGQTPESLENTLAHELHHIGSVTGCPGGHPDLPDDRTVALYDWTGGFSEGLAVLAAAGSPDAYPVSHEEPELQEAWNNRQDSLAADIADLTAFYEAILDGSLTGDDISRTGFSFINRPGSPQGPLYTVGWFMASTVERELGHDSVLATVCHPARLMGAYNRAAERINARNGERADSLPLWPSKILEQVAGF